ncbi:hypothetical protein PHYSODRAFT_303030 [Phytophthora sojae]|uniref:Uncharacterized protein n=1 Tax=Phytophthora sojae (strain P6497) TaxID=1094619 RepID=G4ZUH2_PHYSP|nr:hypothetical protein PHYSODRAFT_303030 [Phytophthora sojae]EGZ13446.1 hypothetical protein PHYSODRAFT_303030 [Phytophthora sojae]|eukprot:XP_009530875.1 hypothetical protein PHYSODRAFT_303030 [Phytophthora sojae]
MDTNAASAERAAHARPNQQGRSWTQWSERYAELTKNWEAETARLEKEIKLADNPRHQVPYSLCEVSKAYSAIAKIPSGVDKSVYPTGFFIAEDGFLLTTSSIYPTADRSTTLRSAGAAPFPIPFVEPDNEFETMDPMVFMPFGDDIAYPSPVVVRDHIGALADPYSELASLELAQPNSLDYAKDILFTGGPVLSLRPHHFVGVVSSIEHDSVVRFCPVTRCSSVWKEIKVTMDK